MWINSSEQAPPTDVDILGAWFLGEWECHVVNYSTAAGKWLRQCDDSGDDFAQPEIWQPITDLPPPPYCWPVPSGDTDAG